MSISRASQLPPEVRFEYPFAGNLLDLPNGAQMHYLDEGSGPVVLLLHGNPTWSFFYRDLIVRLNRAGKHARISKPLLMKKGLRL